MDAEARRQGRFIASFLHSASTERVKRGNKQGAQLRAATILENKARGKNASLSVARPPPLEVAPSSWLFLRVSIFPQGLKIQPFTLAYNASARKPSCIKDELETWSGLAVFVCDIQICQVPFLSPSSTSTCSFKDARPLNIHRR